MYYIIEHDCRPDGITNTSETGRTTFALGLSFFYDRASKGAASEQFTSVHLMLVDDELNIIKAENVPTAYVAPSEEELTAE